MNIFIDFNYMDRCGYIFDTVFIFKRWILDLKKIYYILFVAKVCYTLFQKLIYE